MSDDQGFVFKIANRDEPRKPKVVKVSGLSIDENDPIEILALVQVRLLDANPPDRIRITYEVVRGLEAEPY